MRRWLIGDSYATATGSSEKFQLVALNRRVMVKHNNEVVEAQQAKPNVPDVGDVPDEIAEDAPKVWAIDADELRSKIGIIEVVRRYGKSQGRIDDSREETKIRCPFEDHLDEDPSASANKVKDTWDCYKCNMGGHQIDFFSVRKHGFITEHRSPEFGKLVHEMAEELGFIAPNPVPPPGPAPKAQTPPREDVRISPESEPIVPPSREAKEKVTITEEEMLEGIKKDDDLDIASLSLDWRKLDLPEESISSSVDGTGGERVLLDSKRIFPVHRVAGDRIGVRARVDIHQSQAVSDREHDGQSDWAIGVRQINSSRRSSDNVLEPPGADVRQGSRNGGQGSV